MENNKTEVEMTERTGIRYMAYIINSAKGSFSESGWIIASSLDSVVLNVTLTLEQRTTERTAFEHATASVATILPRKSVMSRQNGHLDGHLRRHLHLLCISFELHQLARMFSLVILHREIHLAKEWSKT